MAARDLMARIDVKALPELDMASEAGPDLGAGSPDFSVGFRQYCLRPSIVRLFRDDAQGEYSSLARDNEAERFRISML